tara:strand:- start:242 stop:616 length:375 start_codon:yes stop_codon:yes gene_type:complete
LRVIHTNTFAIAKKEIKCFKKVDMICKKFLPIVSAFATLQARHQERPHQERTRYTRNALPLPRASLLATCHTHTRAEQKENSTTPGETPRPGREAKRREEKRSNKAAHIFRAPGEEEEEEEEEN